jgi:hypothetical protein
LTISGVFEYDPFITLNLPKKKQRERKYPEYQEVQHEEVDQ